MKKMMPMRLRVLLTILPIAIVPILVVALVTVGLIRDRMINQSRVFYSNIVSQVETNIDFFYNQYAETLENSGSILSGKTDFLFMEESELQ